MTNEKFYTSVYRRGNNILYRGYENGKAVARKVPFQPTMYYQVDTPTDWKTLDGHFAKPIRYSSMSDAQTKINESSEISNFNLHGMGNFLSQYITSEFPEEIKFKRGIVNVLSLDIEVQSDEGFPKPEEANYEVISIAMKSSKENTYYVYGLNDYDVSKSYMKDSEVIYRKCTDEKHLFTCFIDRWALNYPDIVTGWNVKFFDMTYLVNRIIQVCSLKESKRLSPWGYNRPRKTKIMNKEIHWWDIYGVAILDYLDLFKKFGYSYGQQESYKLDHVAHTVLGERKLSYEEHANLYTLYKEDHQKFIDYNIKDVELIERLEDKMGLITLAMVVSYKAGINYAECMGTVGVWDSILYRDLTSRGVVVPPNIHSEKGDYPGGYVKAPQVGLHNWVVSFDLNSLYPNIICQYNMSPETIVMKEGGVSIQAIMDGKVRNNDPHSGLAANGLRFRNDKLGTIPRIIGDLYAERVVVKKNMLKYQQEKEGIAKSDKKAIYKIEKDINIAENKQMAIKILMNSLYGAMGNQYFRYFNQDVAEAITTSGQTTIKWAERALNGYMNDIMGTTNYDHIIAIDTDSVYVNMDPLVQLVKPNNPVAFLDKVCHEKLEKVLEVAYTDLFKTLGGIAEKMVMKREAIADKGIWTAKKRYILNVHNNEGVQYAEPKLKIMGLEAVKSSTPAACRDALKHIFKTIIKGDESDTQEEVAKFKEHFMTLAAHEVSFPRGVSEIDKWRGKDGDIYAKGTPIHVRGALIYNDAINMRNLDNKHTMIQSGEKIKFTYMKMPNPLKSNVVSFPEYLPKEFKADDYVDRDLQFQKTFLKPIEPIFDAIGWSVESTVSLEDFF